MHLYCMRHGEACSAEDDPQKPLTVKGKRDITDIAHFLVSNKIQIDHILHSGKARTKQTAEIIAKILGIQNVTESVQLLAENSSPQELISLIPSWTEETLLVGHLPFMSNLVTELLLNQNTLSQHQPLVNYQPGTIVCLKSNLNRTWLLDWVVHPILVSCANPASGTGPAS